MARVASFSIGQRWISEAEPELGLGTLVEIEGRQIEIVFRATGDRRRYAAASAPLRRIRFKVGDRIRGRDGTTFTVDDVVEDGHILLYQGSGEELTEDELADTLSAGGPDERLKRGQIDEARVHALRTEGLEHLGRVRGSAVRGFLGGRIDVIPHQLYIASEVASRHAPRVLLADEVGLGKTIEACLVLHRQLLSGRVGRALILVPESLVHQWFVELVRRFHLWFKLFDRERCDSIRATEPDANPFLEEQLVLTSLDFLQSSPKDARAAVEAGWDMMIVDEAHRLEWSTEAPSDGYRLVEALARRSPSVLLLSGTPEQLGEHGHFARLRLLDPERHSDLDAFREENQGFSAVADLVDQLSDGEPVDATLRAAALERDPTGSLAAAFHAVDADEEGARAKLVTDLLDRHGTGRVLFRNTRAAIAGFPRRIPHLEGLVGGSPTADRAPHDYSHDPRIPWLLELLKKVGDEKVLLICHSRSQVAAILAAIEERAQLKVAAFHEGLSLVQRDRNAAWFADTAGAQMLVSSEIGSEGRNFQFARHLVLFDLPVDPELLEQRIGRLDRIGQTGDVQIHVPYLVGTAHELLARWHHEALGDLEQSLRGGSEILARVRSDLEALLENGSNERRDADAEARLFAASRRHRDEIADRLERGRDRLLERSSLRPEQAEAVGTAIAHEDDDPTFERYLIRLLEHFGVDIDEIGERSYLFGTEGLYVDAIPGLPAAGLTATFSRRVALAREDLVFLTRDHPLALGALELLLGSEKGNSAFALWHAEDPKGLLLEAHFVVEVVAPRGLGADRFLPPTPIRIVVDQRGEPAEIPEGTEEHFESARPDALLARPEVGTRVLPAMFEAAVGAAEPSRRLHVERARRAVKADLGAELDRLRALRAVNDRVREDELHRSEEEIDALLEHLGTARVRLDAARLVWHGPRAILEL